MHSPFASAFAALDGLSGWPSETAPSSVGNLVCCTFGFPGRDDMFVDGTFALRISRRNHGGGKARGAERP